MRTDVKIELKGKVRIPSIPISSAGRAPFVSRGDFILANIGSHHYYGRVIGFVKNPDDNKKYIVALVITITGGHYERWVEPEQVIDASYSICGLYEDKMKWFFGKEFLMTPPNVARKASELLYEQSIKPTLHEDYIPKDE